MRPSQHPSILRIIAFYLFITFISNTFAFHFPASYNKLSNQQRQHDFVDYKTTTTTWNALTSRHHHAFIVQYSSTSETNADTIKDEESTKRRNTCNLCNKTFSSRNALFRHIRTDRACSQQSYRGIQMNKTHIIAFLVGYDINLSSEQKSESEIISKNIRKLFPQVMINLQQQPHTNSSIVIQSMTQSTEARMRQRLHQQERQCGSIGDVIVLTFQSQIQFCEDDIPLIVKNMNDMFAEERMENGYEFLSPRILAALFLSPNPKYRLHAERHCTQRVYHYLFPLNWVIPQKDVKDVYDWWMEIQKLDEKATVTTQFGPKGYNSVHHPNAVKPPESLRFLKQVLRSAESRTMSSTTKKSKQEGLHKKYSTGRFGLLSNKERRCFHNFADPQLQGDASPNHETVWRSLDRARIVHFLTIEKEMVAILEFRGDGFIRGQIRRIVGSVVGMTNAWLPPDFLSVATQPDVIIETPLAPEGRLYFSNSRYHFEEQKDRGRVLFDDMNAAQWLWMQDLQTRLLKRRVLPENVEKEKQWIHDLQYVIAPRIQAQYNLIQRQERLRSGQSSQIVAAVDSYENTTITNMVSNASSPPPPYGKALKLLRQVVTDNQWPTTSTARQRILRNASNTTTIGSGGSFTVLNPVLLNKLLETKNLPIPKANLLFPELAQSVFELEQELSPKRTSTHCAINCNAEFIPHVDSGRGKGQSLSMIVGLGDYYTGGRIVVEGVYHDIHYNALEFDGWKQRHWTEVFVGERFSLVWFTPDI